MGVASSAAKARRNASPRASKSANWSNEAQAGERSTVGSGAAVERGVVGRHAHALSQVAGDDVRNLSGERRRRIRRRPSPIR